MFGDLILCGTFDYCCKDVFNSVVMVYCCGG